MSLGVPTTLEAWRSALQALLPPGRAFTREPGSTLAKLLEAFAAMFKGTQDTLDAVALEADPRQASAFGMLPEWERLLALPDLCYEPLRQTLVPGLYWPDAVTILDFDRASTAWRFDVNGLLVADAANVLRFEHDLTAPVGQTRGRNHLAWSDALQNWTPYNDVVVQDGALPHPSGSAGALVQSGFSTNDFIKLGHALPAGQLVCLSASVHGRDAVHSKIKLQNAVVGLDVRLDWTGEELTAVVVLTGISADFVYEGDGWYRVWAFVVTTEADQWVRLYGATGANNQGAYFTRVQLERNVLTAPIYTAGAAVSRFAAFGPARYEVEQEAENLFKYSQNPDDAYWGKTRSSVSSNLLYVHDLFGGLAAAKLVEDATAADTHARVKSLPVIAGQTYVWSEYVEADGRSTVALRFSSVGFGVTSTVHFDLTAGVVSQVSGVPLVHGILPAGEAGRWRVWAAMVATATATSQFFLYLDDGPLGNLTYDGDGVSGVLLLGAQMEARAGVNLDGPSSLVPTDATTVVRDADVAVVSVERSEQDRRTQAFARLTEQGGQSRQYFIDLAAALGEPGCTITEFRPMHCNSDCNDALWSEADIFTWRMNIPHSNAGARPMNCNDDCNDPLDLGGESPFACPIRERSPAHTTVLFAYSA